MKNILIATAKTEHMITLSNLLRKRGYQVISCGDADFALSLLRQDMKVDAVLADYEMEGFLRLMRAVRSRPGSPPVIVMSDRVAVSDYLAALSAGAFEFFFWPVRPAELLRIIEAAVRQNADSSAGELQHEAVVTDRLQGAQDSFLFHG